jgi:uncharacterized protein (DUF433 family)/transposase-like protein
MGLLDVKRLGAYRRQRRGRCHNQTVATKTADRRYSVPLYSAAEAARYLDVPPSTFRVWVHGYRPAGGEGTRTAGSPIVTSLPPKNGAIIPFVGFAEAFVLTALRRAGVPLQRIRPALDYLQRELGLRHALASRRLFTDGAEVLYDYAERQAGTAEARALDLVVVRSGQGVFTEVVQNYLRRIEFADDDLARLIHLPQYRGADVLVDPERSFGAPIFARGGNRIEDVIATFKAGEDLDTLVEEFGVPRQELLDVLRVNVAA